jgi:hypothetical protein
MMRTRPERMEDRRDVMAGANDQDVAICQALMELCRTVDDAVERIADAHDEIRKVIEAMSDAVNRQLKQSTLVR